MKPFWPLICLAGACAGLPACSTDSDYMNSDPGTVIKTPAGAQRRSQQQVDEAKSVLTDNERRQLDDAAGNQQPKPPPSPAPQPAN